ncbi:GTP-binding protein [Alphaproteobacteria bacterium LSUCC0719]
MTRQITFTVIGGFLGAGKTSLVNRVLAGAGDVRFAVLVNDFGALNIDQALIESQDSQIMQLSNGCICCSLAGGLVDAMVSLMAYRDRIDHILIEASGVSYPGRIMDFARIDPDLRAGLTLVLIDASSMPAQLEDPRLAEVIAAQMQDADMFLLTKTDIADAEDLTRTRDYLATHQPGAPVLTGRADDADIIEMLLTRHDLPALDRSTATEHQPHPDFISVAMTATTSIDKAAFRDACDLHSGLLVRGKGIVGFVEGVCVWQQSGRRTEFHPVASDFESTSAGPDSRIVLIATAPLDEAVASFTALGFQLLAPEPVPISAAR